MAGDLNPEKAIGAIITILTAGLPTALDAIDSTEHDGITLRDIAAYYRAPLAEYGALPSCVVVASSTAYPPSLRTNAIWLHELQLQVYEQTNEVRGGLLPQEILAARLSRTLKGIDAVLRANDTLVVSGTSNCDQLLIGQITYSSFVPRGDRGVFRGAMMTIQAYVS